MEGYIVQHYFNMGEIKSVEYMRVNEKSYWTESGRNKIDTHYDRFFSDKDKAVEYAIDVVKTRIKSRNTDLKTLNNRLDELKNFRKIK